MIIEFFFEVSGKSEIHRFCLMLGERERDNTTEHERESVEEVGGDSLI